MCSQCRNLQFQLSLGVVYRERALHQEAREYVHEDSPFLMVSALYTFHVAFHG